MRRGHAAVREGDRDDLGLAGADGCATKSVSIVLMIDLHAVRNRDREETNALAKTRRDGRCDRMMYINLRTNNARNDESMIQILRPKYFVSTSIQKEPAAALASPANRHRHAV